MKNRSRTDIICEILRAVKPGQVNRTSVMYGVYLSYKQLMEYLRFLQQKEMIRQERDGKFSLTSTGAELLSSLEKVDFMLTMKSTEPDGPEGATR